MSSGKVKCTCGWSWNKSDSSKKDMYICHECGRDNSNNMKNGGWLDNIEKSQTGKKVLPETEADRAKKVAKKVAGTTGIGMVLDQFPGVETAYDAYNVIDAFAEGDPMKVLPNMLGALIPGTAGKSFEAVTDEYLPKTPKKEKEKMKAVLKGKRATPEQMRKVQENIDWSTGFKKLYDDVSSLFEPSLIDKEKVIKYFNNDRKVQLENGGWLDSYANGGTMQEHQENYNDASVSLPEGFVGMGNNTKGRNYSPAWGGQFQGGGKLTFLQPTSEKLPEGYRIPFSDPSSERAMSIGGENGEPAYLIPSFKYGKQLYNPIEEFKKTGEHLGGPFKTYQEADEWERTVRHPAVERKETIMFPQEKFAMGGSLPGATGHMYARYEEGGKVSGDVGFDYPRTINPAPDNGPYAKKTMASAQNGQEMKYYQEGLDFKPKTISKNGGWLDSYDVAQTGTQVKYGTPEYEEAYNRGEVVTDEGGRSPIQLDEVVIKGKPLTEFGKTRKEIAEKNKWEDFAKRFLGNFEKNMGQTLENLPESRKQEYEDYINKLAFDEYIKTHPQAKGEKRGAYIDRMQAENVNSSNFERAYEANADYNDATDVNKWRKGLIGLGSLVLPKPAMDYMKQKSDYFSEKEKQSMIDNPISTQVGDVLGTIEPLTIPVEGIYGNKSFGDIASGESANIPMTARLLGDPLMLGFEAAPLIGSGFRTAGRLLGTEEGLLSNTYKYNPWAFKPNSEAYYRGIGRTGLDDALESGVLRTANKTGNYGEDLYMTTDFNVAKGNYSRDQPYGKGDVWGDDWQMIQPEDSKSYIAEIPESALTNKNIVNNSAIVINKGSIPTNDVRLLKQDWLQGYKPIEVPIATESVAPKPWSMQELPGLHLQSTMDNGAISKIVEPKSGLINTEQALAIIGKESGGSDKVSLIKQGLGESIPKKMDYNEFRKIVQDQLIPLDTQVVNHSSNYGISSLGYPSSKRSSFEMALNNIDNDITNINNQIEITSSPIKTHYGEGIDGTDVYSYVNEYGVQYYATETGAIAAQKYSLENLNNSLNIATNNKASNLNKIQELPLENKTFVFGNKDKFGRGSNAHGNPDETLGHAHYLIDPETPDVLTVTQIQSDAFQGTHRTMPKNAESAKMSLSRMKEQEETLKNIYANARPATEKGLDIYNKPYWYELPDGTLVSKEQYEIGASGQTKINNLAQAEIENFSQKALLDKNHQERFLQEIVANAAERGDVNKVRVPTSDTAAKVQGYSKNTATGMDEMGLPTDLSYSPEHKTILKKYSEQPKLIKKLFGEEPTIVTDGKGNTWYEFNIPKNFKEGKGQIKAFKEGGIIDSDRGQWDHPGKITRIKGGNITMKKDPKTGKALTEPLLGIADTGEQQWMYPEEDYNFEGANYVTEIPKSKLAKNGLRQEQKGLVNLDNLLNFTNYNTKQPGGWLDKY